jgi:tetratricopeptide (TPR) repeat protein
MSQYLITGRDRSDRKTTECVEAASAQEALETLQARGWFDLVLHTDDHVARISRPQVFNQDLTPRDFLAFRYRGRLARLAALSAELYVKMWKLLAISLAVLAVRRALDAEWHLLDGLCIASFLLPPLIALNWSRTSIQHHRLLTAISWAKWERALRLVPAVRQALPHHYVAWHEAQALAGLGRLDEAIEILRPFGDGQQIPPASFWIRMASVYRAASQRELALEALEKALECAPDDPVHMIGLANGLLHEQRDADRARRLLQRAAQHPISDQAQAFFLMGEGIVAIEEGDARRAIERLEDSLRRKRPFARANPASAAAADVIEGWLALAKVMSGDLTAARRHFRRAEPRLRAKKIDKLLARCQAALGRR